MKVCTLLQSIKDFRSWDAEPGSIGWDNLMHYFSEDAEQYANEQLYDLGYTDEEVANAYDTNIYLKYEVKFMESYLGREEGLIVDSCF